MTKIHKELNGLAAKSTAVVRCALISPPSDSLTQAPPVQLGYLASVLLENGYDTRIFDFKRIDLNKGKLFADLIAFKPDLVGISVITIEMPGTKRLVENIRKHLPYAKIVLGGVHPTVLPDETLTETAADFIIRGEGEKIIVNLADTLFYSDQKLDDVRGITFYEGGKIKSNPDESLIEDLDSIPYPAWEMIPPVFYSTYSMQLYKRRPVVATILTSRGCPFGCSFCASRVHGKKIRYRSPANVVSEMEMLVRMYSVGEFMFLDDNFTMNKEHVLQICEEIIRRNLGIVWKMPQGMRADTVDEELIRYFKRAGCYEVGFGIESGNQKILNRAKKRLDLSIVQRSIALIKKYDIEVYGFFILGLPGENHETIMETIRFMRIGFDHISVSYCIPYPGSDIYNEYIKKNARPDWSMFAHHHIFTGISELSEQDLKKYMRKAILSFYLHPRRAFLLLRKMKSIPLKHTFRLMLNYLWHGK
jgi:anaerobic magnesium-protoporphyrin IX monomethyl ester cyclase